MAGVDRRPCRGHYGPQYVVVIPRWLFTCVTFDYLYDACVGVELGHGNPATSGCGRWVHTVEPAQVPAHEVGPMSGHRCDQLRHPSNAGQHKKRRGARPAGSFDVSVESVSNNERALGATTTHGFCVQRLFRLASDDRLDAGRGDDERRDRPHPRHPASGRRNGRVSVRGKEDGSAVDRQRRLREARIIDRRVVAEHHCRRAIVCTVDKHQINFLDRSFQSFTAGHQDSGSNAETLPDQGRDGLRTRHNLAWFGRDAQFNQVRGNSVWRTQGVVGDVLTSHARLLGDVECVDRMINGLIPEIQNTVEIEQSDIKDR
jgi:hypothetical protein